MVDDLNITEVRVRKVSGDGKLKAFASITIDNAFVVHDLKVIEGKKGFFVAMPSRKTTNGDYKDTAHPIITETREKIQSARRIDSATCCRRWLATTTSRKKTR